MKKILPDKYRNVSESELKRRISELKKKFGGDLCILGHYYQCSEVIDFADYEGDSFALAKEGAATSAKWIVFCGVNFMAESSVILASPGQHVFLPDMDAGCPLADMAGISDVEFVWQRLESLGLASEFLPAVYMNSSAELKAFCGQKGGLVATSSSCKKAFEWVRSKGKRIFFFPDENLGRNTAAVLGINNSAIALAESENGFEDEQRLKTCELIVWKGHCHVHTFFTPDHVADARRKYKDCKIVVHPECYPDVVKLCDGAGSTAYLKKFAEDAKPGSTIVIGTEINLISRLAKKYPEKKILPLARSLCPNMFKISLADLCWTLEELGKVNEVFVDVGITRDAKLALDRMLML